MTDLKKSVSDAIEYAKMQGVDVPPDLLLRAYNTGALKLDGGFPEISAAYHDTVTEILTGYFEGAGLTGSRNAFKRAVVESFGPVFDLGWVDGGQQLPPDGDALSWFNARVEAEFGFIQMLFQQAKELKAEENFDFFSWVTQRADGYTRALKEIYNAAKMRAMKDIMVTFDGDDGAESCTDCQKLKGKRHKISWFVKRNFVPPFGTGLECHPGRRCQHGLFNDKGEQITV